MASKSTLRRVHDLVKLHGDEERHEQTDAWCNRDLVPLPPDRRTWGFFEFFGYWTLSSLNVATWQMPNTFLTKGLSVTQSMVVIVIARSIITFFASFIAWCGLRWHIGFTIQNRFSWGMRGSYIPLIQRVMLNFIWNATQCWTGGKLCAVLITALFPSFQDIPNGLPASVPTTTQEMIGFFIFWLFSIPFLWMPPETFRRPFQFISIYCGIAMICMLIWSLSVSKGVGPLFTKGNTVSSGSKWSTGWIMLNCINSAIGGKAAGMTNGSDFSRYGKSVRGYMGGTFACLLVTGTLVSFVGLVVTAACQNIYGEIYWNPPDLLMRMMDSGKGSSASRAGVFFLALGFAITSGFENICGNAVAGGIDLSGMFPKYINIRRGALITFFAAWIVQPWQLANRATTFLTVLSSFSVFLAPMMGIMTADYFILRRQRLALSQLFRVPDSCYYYTLGFNLRAIPAWVAGWAPTVGGLNATVQGTNVSRVLFELYYLSFFIGFLIAFAIFILLNVLFPPSNLSVVDDTDVYGTFTPDEARRMGLAAASSSASVVDEKGSDGTSVEKIPVNFEDLKEV
ncbi:permease for cytosine/purines, uracil, thiamine, allantoin-domain-containing protein [Vararia minispora EC-137]|uniref:Permease for cytosine/purines, uracil, thiamine, allantoin-domain-containing protein n=1 Tax=Vararia minispora EC-137 TaxID=1314806 RepID=A0ACB8QHS8_9AGAM|nr:permease for cytosine/purines, uracil, thiamine, allantoin-domain-containing protein [Vararia minispora EC-137]